MPPFTQPTSLILALTAALLDIDTISIERWWDIHRKVADRFMDELRALGFGLLIDESTVAGTRVYYSDTVIAVRYPDQIDDSKFRKILFEDFGIFVIGNIGEFTGKSFRVGLMSAPQLQPVNVFSTLFALREIVSSKTLWA